MKSKFSDDELVQRAFLRAARVMFEMWEERGSSDTRLLIEPLIPRQFVLVGVSSDGAEHDEHVVPRKVICDECHKIFAVGTDSLTEKEVLIDTAARLIQKHLKIVLISKREKDRLDEGKQLNLRQRMPKDWIFESGDTYERLRRAEIQFSPCGK